MKTTVTSQSGDITIRLEPENEFEITVLTDMHREKYYRLSVEFCQRGYLAGRNVVERVDLTKTKDEELKK